MSLRRYFWTAVACGFGVATLCLFPYLRGKPRGVLYHDSFSSGMAMEWRAFGGEWGVHEGGVRNNSDELGAKFITGASTWTDYSLEADVSLLGSNGDAGIIVRSSDEEEGMDAYSGYYAALRDHDGTLTIGRADHGWLEYAAVPMKGGVHPFQWYHLKLTAVGCEIVAVASDSTAQVNGVATMYETGCVTNGRIGLRSYSSGGIWRNVTVTSTRPAELIAMRGDAVAAVSPEVRQSEAGFNLSLTRPAEKLPEFLDLPILGDGIVNIPTIALGNLRVMSALHTVKATVQGSVVMTSPALYIQDATGGVEIDSPRSSFLKIGDEVRATGTVALRGFAAKMYDAKVEVLFPSGPAPPLSITASQAATGKFDGMFIEIDGRVEGEPQVTGQSVLFKLRSGHESYPAVLQGQEPNLMAERLQPDSLLRLRGVCAVGPAYTKNLSAFVLLLRSSLDVTVVAGPPWWGRRHLIESALAILVLSFVSVLVFARIEHWRMQAVLEERLRMAREIHDTLAQGFAGIALQLESALPAQRSGVGGTDPIEVAFHMAQQSRGEAHRSIAALRTQHTNVPIEEMLQKILRPQLAGTRSEIVFSKSGTPQRLSAESETQLLRIAQEAVANAVQHAATVKIHVHVAFEAEKLRLDIVDYGRGFEPTRVASVEQGHFGITGMKERAASIKSQLEIESSPSGTRVTVLVPAPRQRVNFWQSIALLAKPFQVSAKPRRYS